MASADGLKNSVKYLSKSHLGVGNGQLVSQGGVHDGLFDELLQRLKAGTSLHGWHIIATQDEYHYR